ncbi:zinc finger MYM-type protein 5-like [Copidosoma floridanum]|uniref:zinc finger MYM-type protein 5-like n=1 Tax=Copidosoma floridanum TaxID=29053 RepID=UPI0006C97129|nr:zinc finger MYM-type protein 5-like [Copidosoma floridanum]
MWPFYHPAWCSQRIVYYKFKLGWTALKGTGSHNSFLFSGHPNGIPTEKEPKKAREKQCMKNTGAIFKYFEFIGKKNVSACDTETSTISSQKSVQLSSSDRVDFEVLANKPVIVGEKLEPMVEVEIPEEINTVDGIVLVNSTKSTGTSESISDCNDIGTWPVLIPDNFQIFVVTRGYKTVLHLDCEFAEVIRPKPRDSTKGPKGVVKKLSRDWFFRIMPNGDKILRTWMAHPPFKKALFCSCCRLFGVIVNDKSGFNTINGFNQWWKLNSKVSEHESSSVPIENFEKWQRLQMKLKAGATIDKTTQNMIVKEKQKLRTYLFAKYDPNRCEHLIKVKLQKKVSISYLSPEIQNEFISCLGNHVRKIILSEVKEAKYFTIVFDSTPDYSHKDQTSQILRYVKLDGTKVQVTESFIDFLETDGKKAKDIAKMILDKFKSNELDI